MRRNYASRAEFGARPGLILFVRSFGNLVNVNPHCWREQMD